MDALTSFTHLSDNIPEWLIKLDELAAQVTEQHSRFTRLTHFTQFKLTRKKHDSTESLRPKDEDDDHNNETALVVTNTSTPCGQPGIANPNVDTAMILKDVRRKRKPGSSLSQASGPHRYRTRSMIIVYYDSAIQDAFETLVRNIASARNNLRKGKTAASFKTRIALLGMEETPITSTKKLAMLDPKLIRSRLERVNQQDYYCQSPEYVPAFDDADRDLEVAQSLCEVAAHQFLRDGNCTEEIEGTRERFAKCLRVAQREADLLRQQRPQEPIKEEAIEEPMEVPKILALDEKVDLLTTKPVNYAGVGTIEVDNDESDASSVHLDLAAFRRGRRV